MAILPRFLAPHVLPEPPCWSPYCRDAPCSRPLHQPPQLWVPHPSPRQKATPHWLHPGQHTRSHNLTGCQLTASDCPSSCLYQLHTVQNLLRSPMPLLRNQQNLSFLNMYFIVSLAESGLSCGSSNPRCGTQSLVVHGLSSCGTWALLPCGVWGLSSQPEMESASPAVQGGFLTTDVPSRFS